MTTTTMMKIQVQAPAGAAEGAAAHECRLLAERGGMVLGQLRLRAGIGLDRPRWWYHVGCAVHAAAELNLFHRQPTLLLGNDLTGAAELCDIEVAGDDAAVLDALIAHAQALVQADPQRWGPRLIAELPGVRDAAGRSPFWQGLGRHFHSGDTQAEAARFGAEAWRAHVAALLPRQLVYTSFLARDAQDAIGVADASAQTLRAALERAGLRFAGHVRIDDGGPVVEGW
jgi:arginine N-succinyltransferase